MRLFTLPLLILMASSVYADKPNIVLIFADDLGWKDTGYTHSDYYETPNIDKLAKTRHGLRLWLCLSWQLRSQSGLYALGDNTPPRQSCFTRSTAPSVARKKLMRLEPIPNKSGLPKSSITMADALENKQAMRPEIFGKWHLDGPDGAKPTEQGFDVLLR